MKNLLLLLATMAILSACQTTDSTQGTAAFNVDKNLDYNVVQASKTITDIPGDSLMPRRVENGEMNWQYVSIHDWTSGFWPGTLWYLYEYTGEEKWKEEADHYTRLLTPLSQIPAGNHDLGFMVYNSFGNGYRLTGNPEYKKIILRTADTLATLYNPTIGTIHSWPRHRDFVPHNTIVDNMMNLELLFWASKNGGTDSLYDIAVKHAETTMKNHFREDYSSYHLVVYDDQTGEPVRKVTVQGYADESMWARGHSWAIYGFTLTARETGRADFLDFAQKLADVYIERLPDDFITYWDFDAPNIPDAPRDASSAAIAASAFLELSTLVPDVEKAGKYRRTAERILEELSANYQSNNTNPAFLLHSTGHLPGNSEIDVSINYADYYYAEALMRLKKLQEGKPILQ